MMENQHRIEEVEKNIKEIRADIVEAATKAGRDPNEITLMAVTKTVDPAVVNQAIACGVEVLGENRVQEFLSKYDLYDKEHCEIHFIGHLQTNKVKYIVDKVAMIHSVDSYKLAEEIEKQAAKINKVMPILIEVNIGNEESKSGIDDTVVYDLCKQISKLSHVKIKGLMCIPPFSEDEIELNGYFRKMYELFIDIREKKIDNVDMDFLSMGMSMDYKIAIQNGANIIRLGTRMFGSRK